MANPSAGHQKITLPVSTSQKRAYCGVRRSQKLPHDTAKNPQETPSCTSTGYNVFQLSTEVDTPRAFRPLPSRPGTLWILSESPREHRLSSAIWRVRSRRSRYWRLLAKLLVWAASGVPAG